MSGTIQQNARNLLNAPRHKTNINKLYQRLFGVGSIFYQILQAISDGKPEATNLILELLPQMVDQQPNLEQASLSYDKINDYLKNIWEEIRREKKGPKLPGFVEFVQSKKYMINPIYTNIEKRIAVMVDWLSIHDPNSQQKSDFLNQLVENKNKLLGHLEKAIAALSHNKDSFGSRVLRFTTKRIYEYLNEGISYQRKWDYIELLRSPYMSLDDSHLPLINPALQMIEGFEPWRRMLRHIKSNKYSFDDILRFIGDPKRPEWDTNYSTAKHINEYLYEKEGIDPKDYTDSIEFAKRDAESAFEEFKSIFELAYVYGNIKEQTKETIIQTVLNVKDYFIDTHNFTHFKDLLNVLKKRIEEEKIIRKEQLEQSKQEIERKHDLKNTPIMDYIEEYIRDNNFSVAEHLLNRADNGLREVPKELQQDEFGTDYHGAFINMYQNLYNVCKRYKNNTPVNWGPTWVEKHLIRKKWPQGKINDSINFIKNWPKSKGSFSTRTQLNYFLKGLKFQVRSVQLDEKRSTYRYDVYKVKVEPTAKHLSDYSHPIAQFGTKLKSPLYVVCMFGTSSSEEVVNTMANALQLGEHHRYYGWHIDAGTEKKIAEQFKSDTSSYHFSC